MNIVVTNDDGLHTPGIWTLAEALAQVGNVTIMAPDREQSGVGLGITLQHPVKVSEAISRIEGIRSLAVEGTPADTVILAVQGLTPQPVDLVVAGINEGSNTGMNVLVSGTVGAAFQAHLWSIPAIAISVAGVKDLLFGPAARVAQVLARMFRDGTLSGPMLLNVNLPSIPLEELEGIVVTRLVKGRYVDTIKQVDSEKYDYYWVARGKAEWELEEGTDAWAIRNKRVSITPLHMDLTSDMNAPMLEDFAQELFRELKP